MRIGIIAEGTEDQSVIKNILRAFKIDRSDIIPLKPTLQKDANDENNPDDPTIGTLQGVKKACIGFEGKRPYFDKAFLFSDADFVVIHLDTAEIEQQDFPFQKPPKEGNENYATELRILVIDLINTWLENNYADKLLYAIAIEEIEAWCLTLFEQRDSVFSANAKRRFNHILNSTNMEYDFEKISEDFRKIKKLKFFLPYNSSLREFVESVQEKLVQFS